MTNTAPQLPDTSTWRKIEPGEIVPAGTTHIRVMGESMTVSTQMCDFEIPPSSVYTYYADLPDPALGSDLSLIPEGFPNAKLLRINGVVGTWYRHTLDRHVVLVTPAAMSGSGLKPCQVKSVEPVTILGDDEVAVPRELVKRASVTVPSIFDGVSDIISIPRPVVPHGPKGVPENTATAGYLREVLRKIDTGFLTVGGSNVTDCVRSLLIDTARALEALDGEDSDA